MKNTKKKNHLKFKKNTKKKTEMKTGLKLVRTRLNWIGTRSNRNNQDNSGIFLFQSMMKFNYCTTL